MVSGPAPATNVGPWVTSPGRALDLVRFGWAAGPPSLAAIEASTASAPEAAPSGLSARASGLLAVAIVAVSSAAILARWARPEPLALAFWRTAGGAVVLGAPAWRAPVRPRGRQWGWLAAAGMALALHFATWLVSLRLTSVAASVTLVCSSPLMIALWLWAAGRRPSGRTWAAIGLSFVGVALILAGDATGGAPPPDGGRGSALAGDLLALAGAACIAVYFVIGDRLRVTLPTSVYAGWTYAAAAAVLAPMALVSGVSLVHLDGRAWVAVVATVIGPQLAGHTVLNALLKQLGSITVSLALLLEPFGSSLLAWVFLSELPPLAVVAGAPLVVAGLALQLMATRSSPPGP